MPTVGMTTFRVVKKTLFPAFGLQWGLFPWAEKVYNIPFAPCSLYSEARWSGEKAKKAALCAMRPLWASVR